MYGYSAQSGGLARLLVSVSAVAVVGIPVALILNHGGSINLGLLPYAIPAAAIAIAILVAIGHAIVGPGPQRIVYVGRRGSPASGVLIGVVGLAVGGWLMFGAGHDAKAYANDPSCSAGFTLDSGTPGACRLAGAHIDAANATGGRSTSYSLNLTFGDGSTGTVTLGREVRGNVWTAARNGSDESATVQYYGNRIVQVETRSGLAHTSRMPIDLERTWALVGIGAGLLGLVSAARVILTSGIV
jgi:hypothetical protein